jgi:Tol biopolymer transport system component
MAAPFDPRTLDVGTPVAFVDDVLAAEISSTGSLAYTTYPSAGSARSRLLLAGPGDDVPEVLAELDGAAWFPRVSPDGSRVAYALSASRSNLNDDSDLWVMELSRGARTRVTFTGNNRFYPIWTRDGGRLTYADGTANQNRLLSSPADGSGGSDTLFALADRRYPSSWSPDGRTLAYYVGPAGTPTITRDIWLLQLNSDTRSPMPFIETEFMERGALFSPDGTWIAYVSDKSGRNDVYARPYPGPGSEITVSVGGGAEPVWGPRGDRLYYRRENELMVVEVERAAQSLSVRTPMRVMEDRYVRDAGGAAGGMANYDISSSGDRFIMIEDVVDDTVEPSRLHLVLNFFEELRTRVPN